MEIGEGGVKDDQYDQRVNIPGKVEQQRERKDGFKGIHHTGKEGWI